MQSPLEQLGHANRCAYSTVKRSTPDLQKCRRRGVTVYAAGLCIRRPKDWDDFLCSTLVLLTRFNSNKQLGPLQPSENLWQQYQVRLCLGSRYTSQAYLVYRAWLANKSSRCTLTYFEMLGYRDARMTNVHASQPYLLLQGRVSRAEQLFSAKAGRGEQGSTGLF